MNSNTVDAGFREMKDLLNGAWDLAKNKELKAKLEAASQALDDLSDLWDENVSAMQAELLSEKERFEFLFRQLRGLAEKFRGLAAKSPECLCGSFKAWQVNQVLTPLKGLMDPAMNTDFPLVSEKEENSYSDVALLLQLIMDAAAAFAKRQYNISYDYKGEEIPRYRYGYHR